VRSAKHEYITEINAMNKNIKISLIISILVIVLMRFYPVLERKLGGFWNILINLSIFILIIWMVIKIFREVYKLFKVRKRIHRKDFIPVLILIIAFLEIELNFFNIDFESSYGKVDTIAYYSGTQNQAILKLRENGNFDIHWTGAFFSDNFYIGKYERKGDSLIMDFESEIPRRFGRTLIIIDYEVFTIKSDSLIPTYFYLSEKLKNKKD